MLAAYLPGNSTIRLAEVERPVPGPGQVLLAMKASTICGSDLRAIYREHLGEGPEAYQGVIGGHEPAGEVIEVGPGVHRLGVGARVVVYHISGCGQCDECRRGYQISCTSPLRAAYGWQRDGGHADVLLAEERDLLELPDSLSYLDGACVACGFGTAYEALCRVDLSGRDRLLITGLGPVGLAVGLLAKRWVPRRWSAPICAGAARVGGTAGCGGRGRGRHRRGADRVAGGGRRGGDRLLGRGRARHGDPAHRRWGRVGLVGEGGRLTVDVSEALIHRQLTVHGSWVWSTGRMAELLERLDRWGCIRRRRSELRLAEASEAYALADSGVSGKVGIVWP